MRCTRTPTRCGAISAPVTSFSTMPPCRCRAPSPTRRSRKSHGSSASTCGAWPTAPTARCRCCCNNGSDISSTSPVYSSSSRFPARARTTSPSSACAAGPNVSGRSWKAAACAPSACIRAASVPTSRRHRSEEHTSELQSHHDLVCRLLLEKKKKLGSGRPNAGVNLELESLTAALLGGVAIFGGKGGVSFFFFNDTATTEIYTLSLHDALPICLCVSPLGRSSSSPMRAMALVWAIRSEEQRLNSSHITISYAVFCLKKKKK